jgi:hypothetical protein
MKRFVAGADRGQSTLLPECLDDFIDESNRVRVIDVYDRQDQPGSGQDDGPATIAVPVSYRGEAHKVLVHVLLDEADGWLIASIIYDNGKSLIDHYAV